MPLPLALRKLISPVEVKLVLSAFNEETRRLKESSQHLLGASLGADLVAPRAREDIFRCRDQVRRDVHEGKPPRILVLYLMMNVARDYLASGTFHVYRGTLSMSGEGLDALNRYCCKELEILGQMTLDEEAEILRATAEDIRDVG
jgi:hypothetical protein